MTTTQAKPQATHDNFTIERRYRSAPAKVFEAFADPAIKRRWYVEGPGFIVDSYTPDFRVGGKETSAFTVDAGDFKSDEIRNDTYYFDIVDQRRIVYAYSMSNVGVPFSASLSTVLFEENEEGGTTLTFHEQVTFFEGADSVRMRETGTRQLLERLAEELGEQSAPVDWGSGD